MCYSCLAASVLDKRDGHLSNIVICLYDVQAALFSTGHNLQAHKMQIIKSTRPLSIEEKLSWALLISTENINQKTLLFFFVLHSDEFNNFTWPDCEKYGDHELIYKKINMTIDDVGHAYFGLVRTGIITTCPSSIFEHVLNVENKVGAKF